MAVLWCRIILKGVTYSLFLASRDHIIIKSHYILYTVFATEATSVQRRLLRPWPYSPQGSILRSSSSKSIIFLNNEIEKRLFD